VVNPDNHESVIYLWLHETHHQQIILPDGCCSINDSDHPSPENSSSAMDPSDIMDHINLNNAAYDYGCYPVENDTYFNSSFSPIVQDIDIASVSDDINCLACHDDSNCLTYPVFIPH
jgi:hypothetical protein